MGHDHELRSVQRHRFCECLWPLGFFFRSTGEYIHHGNAAHNASSNASNYPDATHVLQSANGEFFTYDSVGLMTYGKVTSSTTASYANPLTMVPPLMHHHARDSIASTLVWNGLTANVTDKAEVQGIAGTVTMPDGVSYQMGGFPPSAPL